MDAKRAVKLFSLLVLACFICVLLFTLPAIIPAFNLEGKDDIASAISGLTAPIIGIVSSVLLYLALMKQNDSMVDQKHRNENDIILLLFTHLTEQVNQFYFEKTKDGQTTTTKGLAALKEFIMNYCHKWNLSDPVFKDVTFSDSPYGVQYLLLIDLYSLIEDRLLNSGLPYKEEVFYRYMLHHYYSAYFRKANTLLIDTFEKYPHQKDDRTVEIEIAYKHWKDRSLKRPFEESAEGFLKYQNP